MLKTLKEIANDICNERVKNFPKQTKNWTISTEFICNNGKYKLRRYIKINDKKYTILADPYFIHGIFFNEEKQQWYGIK